MDHLFSWNDVPESWRARPVFEVKGRTYLFFEVVQAAGLRGDLTPFSEAVYRRWRLQLQAQAEGLETDAAVLEARIEEYRYARDLISAQETERWLSIRGLVLDDFFGYIDRLILNEQRPDFDPQPIPLDPQDFIAPLLADLMLSGEFLKWARKLAREIVSVGENGEPSLQEARDLVRSFRTEGRNVERDWAGLLEVLALQESKAIQFLHWQRVAKARLSQVFSPEHRAALLIENRLAFIRVELETVSFDSPEAAREGYLCVLDDKVPLDRVAMDAGYPLEHQVVFLSNLPESWHLSILGTHPGSTLPPLSGRGTFDVCRVIRFLEPHLGDPTVSEAVDGLLLQRHFGDAEARDVRWQIGEVERA